MRHCSASALRLLMTFSVAAGIRISHPARQHLSRIRSPSAPREAVHRSGLRADAPQQRIDVDALRIPQAAVNFGDRNHQVAFLKQQLGRIRAHIAKPLHNHTGSPRAGSPRYSIALSHITEMPRPVASRRPREPPMFTGLPVTTAGHRLPLVHGKRVHHPGHRLLVGPYVRRGHVLLGPINSISSAV